MRAQKLACVLTSAVLCLCFAFLGLMAAAELTLFKEGYLVSCMKKTGYIEQVTDTILDTCHLYAEMAGVDPSEVDQFVLQEDVQTDILINMDARYRNISKVTMTHFGNMALYFENTITWANEQRVTDEQISRFKAMQSACDVLYMEAVRPPFDAAISYVLQYRSLRKWAWLIFAVLAGAAISVQKTAVGEKIFRREGLAQSLLGASLAMMLFSLVLWWKLPYQQWMPQSNLAYPLFCCWMQGIPWAVLTVGLIFLLLFFVCIAVPDQGIHKHAIR